jgi:hypothetical protein
LVEPIGEVAEDEAAEDEAVTTWCVPRSKTNAILFSSDTGAETVSRFSARN